LCSALASATMKTICGLLALLGVVFAEEPKQYPVTKVVDLLKDMQTTLEKEGEEDEEVDEKMKCWCTKTEQEKTEAISTTEAHIVTLGSAINSSMADTVRLETEITGHQEDLEKAKESLASATSQREKQAKTFQTDEKELEQSLLSVTLAIRTLEKKSEKSSFLSSTKTKQEQQKAWELLHELQLKNSDMLMGVITPHQRKLVLAVTSAHVSKKTAPVDDYTPASSEVLGIMTQMKDTFETNLNETRESEVANKASFLALSTAKQTEIKATEDALVEKGTPLAAAKTKNAEAKEDLADSEKSLAADQKFLADAKAKCADFDAEYAERVKSRTEEIEGCAKAQEILTDDANRDTFSKTLGFLQTASVTNQEEAAAVLRAAARKANNSKLAALAATVRLDTFDEVKKQIDELHSSLATAQQEEVAQKDSCVQRLSGNSLDIQQTTNDKSLTASKLTGLQASVVKTNNSVNTLKSALVEMKEDLVTAESDMKLKVKEFQQTIADQTKAQEALKQALNVLKQVYDKPKSTSLVQKATPAGDQPKGFKDYAPSSGSTGAVGLLEQIIGDSKVMVKEAELGIEEAQKDFAAFKEDTDSAVATKNQSLIDLGVQKSETSESALAKKDELQELESTATALAQKESALHEECDFLLKNFDIRQEARSQEMEALDTANAFLNGMQGGNTTTSA